MKRVFSFLQAKPSNVSADAMKAIERVALHQRPRVAADVVVTTGDELRALDELQSRDLPPTPNAALLHFKRETDFARALIGAMVDLDRMIDVCSCQEIAIRH